MWTTSIDPRPHEATNKQTNTTTRPILTHRGGWHPLAGAAIHPQPPWPGGFRASSYRRGNRTQRRQFAQPKTPTPTNQVTQHNNVEVSRSIDPKRCAHPTAAAIQDSSPPPPTTTTPPTTTNHRRARTRKYAGKILLTPTRADMIQASSWIASGGDNKAASTLSAETNPPNPPEQPTNHTKKAKSKQKNTQKTAPAQR